MTRPGMSPAATPDWSVWESIRVQAQAPFRNAGWLPWGCLFLPERSPASCDNPHPKGEARVHFGKLGSHRRVRLSPATHDNLAKALLRKGQVGEAMVHYRKFLEIEPENVEARNTLGTALIQQGHVKEAIDQWQDALAIQPENGNAASNLAWVFATCPEDSIRDGSRAAELGEKALRISGGKIPMIYKVLAAAYAESGRFGDAIETAQRGAELATNQGNPALAAELESNIALYGSDRPLRDPTITNGSSSP